MELFLKRRGFLGLKRFLSDEEIALVKEKVQTAAGFWAAKEACAKALGCGIGAECGFHDIILSKTPKGAPIITLSDKVKKSFNIANTSVSISHHTDYTIAVVALEQSKS